LSGPREIRQRDRSAAEPSPDPRRHLKRLRTRAEKLERSDAAWALAPSLDHLFAACEALLPLSNEQAEAALALEHLFAAVGDLLDGVE
jgi:hypothetical protein